MFRRYIAEIFSLKAMNCQASWIIEDMHVTSQVGSRKISFLTASHQYEPKTQQLRSNGPFPY